MATTSSLSNLKGTSPKINCYLILYSRVPAIRGSDATFDLARTILTL